MPHMRPTTKTPSARLTRGRPRIVQGRYRGVVTGLPERGEVWWCELPGIGRRPVVVLSRNSAIPPPSAGVDRSLHDDRSRSVQRSGSRPNDDPVPRPSAANLDAVESVSLGTLVERLRRLSDERMIQVCAALAVAVDCAT